MCMLNLATGKQADILITTSLLDTNANMVARKLVISSVLSKIWASAKLPKQIWISANLPKITKNFAQILHKFVQLLSTRLAFKTILFFL